MTRLPLAWSLPSAQSEIRDLRAKAEQMQKLAREMLAQSERVITLCNEVEAGVREMVQT